MKKKSITSSPKPMKILIGDLFFKIAEQYGLREASVVTYEAPRGKQQFWSTQISLLRHTVDTNVVSIHPKSKRIGYKGRILFENEPPMSVFDFAKKSDTRHHGAAFVLFACSGTPQCSIHYTDIHLKWLPPVIAHVRFFEKKGMYTYREFTDTDKHHAFAQFTKHDPGLFTGILDAFHSTYQNLVASGDYGTEVLHEETRYVLPQYFEKKNSFGFTGSIDR